LEPTDVTELERIPITRPARTIVDLAGVGGRKVLARAVAHAERRGLVDREELEHAIARGANLRGIGTLRRLLGSDAPHPFIRSEAEEVFRDLVRRARLPRPEVNVSVKGFEVDFYWRAQRLVVEVDGFNFHASRTAFENDRRRDVELAGAGIRVLRITWRQLKDEPEAILARLAQALAHPGRITA
jgi:very-short-patch-repair endonuclease